MCIASLSIVPRGCRVFPRFWSHVLQFPALFVSCALFSALLFWLHFLLFLWVNFVSQVWLASWFPISTSIMVSARLIIVFLYLFLTFSVASVARSPAFYCFLVLFARCTWPFHSSGLRFILSRAFCWLLSFFTCCISAPPVFNFCHAFYSRYCLFWRLFVICCTSLVHSRSLSGTLSPNLPWKLRVSLLVSSTFFNTCIWKLPVEQ